MSSDDANITRSARLPGELDEEFEAYREKYELNNSEAMRELVRTGIAEKRAHPLDDRPDALLAGVLWDAQDDIHTHVLITVLAAAASITATPPLSSVFAVVSGFYLLVVVVGLAARDITKTGLGVEQ